MPIKPALSRHSTKRSDGLQNSSLLSAPRSETSSRDIPFKPKDSDTTSLKMRTHRGGRRLSHRPQSNRTIMSSGEVGLTSTKLQQHDFRSMQSRSMPSLKNWPQHNGQPRSIFERNKNEAHSKGDRARRWTLPSKAAPIAGTPSFVLVEKQKQKSRSVKFSDSQSPAMITLRRASTGKTPRKTSITFFPPPSFSRGKRSFFYSFLTSVTGADNCQVKYNNQMSGKATTDPELHYPSIKKNKVCPSTTDAATTVCTEILDIEPKLSQVDNVSVTGQSHPFSARYVSRNSIYEIIWDENSLSSRSDEIQSGKSSEAGRRQSAAVDSLEVQLNHAIEQSRRQSIQAQAQEDETKSLKAAALGDRRSSFRSQINFKLSRLFNEAALQNLPRSRMSSTVQTATPVVMTADFGQNLEPDSILTESKGNLHFFPPLRSRAVTNPSETSATCLTPTTCPKIDYPTNSKEHGALLVDIEAPIAPKDATGSLMGASSHVRRRSTGPKIRVQKRHTSESAKSHRRPIDFELSDSFFEDETVPLLTTRRL